MPFGYSKKIFKYPTIQYIPLKLYQEINEENSRLKNSTYFYIFNQFETNSLNKKISFLQLVDYKINKNQLALFVKNGIIKIIQYRGHEVTMVGEKKQGHLQVFKITTTYFYKKRLLFIFYDGDTSKIIARKSYDLTKLKKT